MRTLGAILTGVILMAAIATGISVASDCQWDDEDVVTTVFDPTDSIHRP